MDFGLSTDQEAFRELCREFAEREIGPRWEAADAAAELPVDLLAVAAEKGLLGVSLPESAGGLGLGMLEEVILAEETARVNCNLSSALMLQGSLLPGLVNAFGTPAQIARYVGPVLAGKHLLAIAVTEPQAGSDVRAIRTTAVRDGDDWLLTGEKCFITLGATADTLLVLAYVDRDRGLDGMAVFLVDAPAEGLRTVKMDMLANRPIPTSRIFLDAVRVPGSARLDAGFREVMHTFNQERIIVAARWLGHARHMFDWALNYATHREQFGKRIGDFQSIAFGFADCRTAIEAARLLVYQAAWSWDQQRPSAEIAAAASYAKLAATRTTKEVGDFALHVGGGWALVDGELPIAKMVVDSWVAPVAGGSFEVQRRIIARQLGLRTE